MKQAISNKIMPRFDFYICHLSCCLLPWMVLFLLYIEYIISSKLFYTITIFWFAVNILLFIYSIKRGWNTTIYFSREGMKKRIKGKDYIWRWENITNLTYKHFRYYRGAGLIEIESSDNPMILKIYPTNRTDMVFMHFCPFEKWKTNYKERKERETNGQNEAVTNTIIEQPSTKSMEIKDDKTNKVIRCICNQKRMLLIYSILFLLSFSAFVLSFVFFGHQIMIALGIIAIVCLIGYFVLYFSLFYSKHGIVYFSREGIKKKKCKSRHKYSWNDITRIESVNDASWENTDQKIKIYFSDNYCLEIVNQPKFNEAMLIYCSNHTIRDRYMELVNKDIQNRE